MEEINKNSEPNPEGKLFLFFVYQRFQALQMAETLISGRLLKLDANSGESKEQKKEMVMGEINKNLNSIPEGKL